MTIDEILKEFEEKWEDEFSEFIPYTDGIQFKDGEKVKEFIRESLKSYAKYEVVRELESLLEYYSYEYLQGAIFERISELKGAKE